MKALLFLAGLIAVSGCLSDEHAGIDSDVEVMVGEMYFQQDGTPEDVIEASQGEEIGFFNEGDVPHTVTIPEYGVDEHLEPGETLTVEASDEVDDALVDCTYHGSHEAELTVS